MPYSDATDLQRAAGGADRLLQLTDWDADGSEDAGVVDDAIATADGWIDSRLRGRYQTPLAAPVPEAIRRMSARLALYELKRRRDALTEHDLITYEQDIQWLVDMREGRADPGTSPPPTKSSADAAAAYDRDTTKSVSRAKLAGFS